MADANLCCGKPILNISRSREMVPEFFPLRWGEREPDQTTGIHFEIQGPFIFVERTTNAIAAPSIQVDFTEEADTFRGHRVLSLEELAADFPYPPEPAEDDD
jgi:hypothetical protein